MILLVSGGIARAETTKFDSKFLTVKPWVAIASYGYGLKNDAGAELKWNPNSRAGTGLDFYLHGYFGFGIGGLTELKSEDRILKGDTNYSDYRFSWAFKSFQVVANYQEFRGFYLENTSYIDPSWTSGAPYHQQPDMYASNKHVSFTWIMDPGKYSLEAASDQSVRQSSSGGSWLVGGSAAQARFSNTSPLVPTAVAGQYGVDASVTSADFTNLSARGGYGHTFCFGTNWFATTQGILGLGQQFAHFSDATGTRQDTRLVPKFDLLLSTGYNGDQWLSGLIVDADAASYRTASMEFSVALATLKLYFGTRF